MTRSDDLTAAIAFLRKRQVPPVKLAIILGSGLGSFADSLQNRVEINSSHIPRYPASTVAGHAGKLVFGTWDGIPLVAVQGRTHYYEGYDIKKVTFIVRILKALGVQLLIVTNAAGGVNRGFRPGDLMLITDQLNLMFRNPLIGPLEYGGPRFPDMSNPYSVAFQKQAEEVALARGIDLKHGVLYASTGPSYETRAEVRMIEQAGGDAVSMSTVPEVIAANQAGLPVIGISCITNMATGISDTTLSHEEVTGTAEQVRNKFIYLITGIIERLGKSKEF